MGRFQSQIINHPINYSNRNHNPLEICKTGNSITLLFSKPILGEKYATQ